MADEINQIYQHQLEETREKSIHNSNSTYETVVVNKHMIIIPNHSLCSHYHFILKLFVATNSVS